MVVPSKEGGVDESRDAEDNIIISDSTLCNILSPQLKKINSQYNIMCSCECCISAKIVHQSWLTFRDIHIKDLKDISCNAQNRRSDELSSRLFETYKISVRPNGCHIYNSSADIFMTTMCPCPSQHHGLPHYKFVLRCCKKGPGISISCHETNKDATKTCSTIHFYLYHNVSCCNVHGIHPYEE